MSKRALEAIRTARSSLYALKNLIHYQSQGDLRFRAAVNLDILSKSLETVYAECLGCNEGDQDDSEGKGS